MEFKLSEDQRKVLRTIWTWFRKSNKQVLTFGGYAGTGKTTMTAIFRKTLEEYYPQTEVAFCSYTGKAAQILRTTLAKHNATFPQDSTGTIHSLIYEPQTNESGEITSWQRTDSLEADLIIVDEASMVSREIWQNLLSFHIPILAVGDHGQLPPVQGNFNLMEDPDLKLEKIHRQAKDNPIIRLSQKVREEEEIPYGTFGPVRKLHKEDLETRSEVEDILRNHSQDLLVLVGKNKSRVQLNQEIRRLLGRETANPQVNDRVICLKNNSRQGVYNGMLGNITSLSKISKPDGKNYWYQTEIEMDEGFLFSGEILRQQFGAETTIKQVDGLMYKEIGNLFDFGYVITVHKAQGSQAPKVLLFEERFSSMTDEEWQRWLYTGVTRAEEELIIVG
ncbi:MAG: ATP-dependent DNA helicase [Patescibacteria group bacterium]